MKRRAAVERQPLQLVPDSRRDSRSGVRPTRSRDPRRRLLRHRRIDPPDDSLVHGSPAPCQAKAERSRLPASSGGSAPRRFGSSRGAHVEPARFTGDPAWRHADATRCSRSTSIGRASPSRIRIADASTHRPPLLTAETTARRPMARTVPGSPGRPIAPRRTARADLSTSGGAAAAGRFTPPASRSRRRFARSAAAAPFARQAEHRAREAASSGPAQSTHWRPRVRSRHSRAMRRRRRRQTSHRLPLGGAGRRRHRLQRRTTARDHASPGGR